jgi:4-diphosphocytidyl-2-C-methyl-D-erythritol kinase
MTTRLAHAKINLALVVGPMREDGKHEVVTVLQRVALADTIALSVETGLTIEGFAHDTIVRRALTMLAGAAGIEPSWRVRIDKEIPVAAGLGGGSSDAAAALLLANQSLGSPFTLDRLTAIAAELGADVPFFLHEGPQLGTGDGSRLAPLDLPEGFTVVLLMPDDVHKESTARVYAAFDERDGSVGFDERRAVLCAALSETCDTSDLAALPMNDLVTSPLSERFRSAGAIRADVSGAGPCVYGVFVDSASAVAASRDLQRFGRTWVTTAIR